MPRYIFPAATGIATGGRRRYARVYRTVTATRPLEDLWNLDGNVDTTPVPSGRLVVLGDGSLQAFAGPDDLTTLWREIEGEPGRVAIEATDPVAYTAAGGAGNAGASAYDIAVAAGFVGTEEDWLDSLVGPAGPEGPEGPAGDAATLAAALAPLAGIGKSAASAFRVLQIGTSIANSYSSPNWVMAQRLVEMYGVTGMYRTQAGPAGGVTNPRSGWTKQPYGGLTFVRAKGTSGSSDWAINGGYGDQVVVEWSQESDSAAATVLIDGVSAGTFGTAGAQRYGNRTVFTVTRGSHSVTIQPPASGACYLEAVEIRDSQRRGVEIIDGTLGGSSLSYAASLNPPTGAQTAGIAIQPGAGLEALFGRDDIDLILMSYTVNDAGANPGDPTAADYRRWLEQGVAAAARRGTPVVLQIEPAGHYAMTNIGGSTARSTRYAAIKAHQLAVAAANLHVFVSDWDTATRINDITAYAAAYYSNVTSIDEAAGTFSGDFIHPDPLKSPSSQSYGITALAGVLGVPAPTWTTYPQGEFIGVYGKPATALLPTHPASDLSRIPRAVFRDSGQTNRLASVNTMISGAGTTDANGKYYLANNYNMGLGGATGTKWWLVARIGPANAVAGGTVSLAVSGSALRIWDPDTLTEELPGVGVGKQARFASVPGGAVVTIAMLVDQSSANQYFTVNGRLYEVALVAAANPTLVTAPA